MSRMKRLLAAAAISGWLLLAGSTPSRADPISIALLTTIGIEATATAVAVTTFVITTAAAIGLSYLAAALQPSADQPAETVGGTTGKLEAGGAVPRSFVVGRAMTAGSLVYANTFGQDGNTPNAYVVQVIALSDLPVAGMPGLLVGGETVTFDQDAAWGDDGIAIPEYTVDGREYLWVRFYNGMQTGADARLVSLFGADPDRPYTTRRIGVGVAYAVVTALVNEQLFSSFPACKFVIDGVPLYDRRFDNTAGGSGSQRWSDRSTWALTSNPIVIAENVLRGISFDGEWLYGAQTVTGTQLPAASWMAAASECDAAVALDAGGTEPQFQASGEIRLDTQPADAIDELLKSCNGKLAEIGGTYKVRAGAAGSAVLSFTDADILSTEQQTFDPFPSLAAIINNVTAKYISPPDGWNEKDAPPLQSDELEAADGGRRQSVDVTYGFVTSGTAVQRLMKAARDENRAWRLHALPMPPDIFVLEPLDVISWTSARNGYTDKTFEIVSADDLPNLNMALSVKELDPNAYDWEPSTDEQQVTDGSIRILRPAPQPIIDWFAGPYTITANGLSRPAILVGWDPNTDDVNGVRLEVRLTATSEVVLRDAGDAHVLAAGGLIVSQGLLPATAYQARGQYRPASPRPVLWSDWLDVTTPDARLVPDDFAQALHDMVTAQNTRIGNFIEQTEAAIALILADQEAGNYTDKKDVRTDLVSVTNDYASAITAAITGESLVETSPEAARAELRTKIEAAVTGIADAISAAIENINTVSVTLTASIAEVNTTLTAAIGEQAVTITENATAIATVDGKLVGSWSAKVDAHGSVAEIEELSDGTTAALKFRADLFGFYLSSGAQLPFLTGQVVNGVSTLALAGNLYADGIIQAQMLSTGQLLTVTAQIGTAYIQTLHLADASVTVPGGAFATGNLFAGAASANTLVARQVLSIPSTINGSTIWITMQGKTDITITAGATGAVFAQIGTVEVDRTSYAGGSSGGTNTFHFQGFFSVAGTGGTVTVNIDLYLTSNNTNDFCFNRSVFGVSYKK